MNTKNIRYLLAIEQYKTISKAAQSLGISQPALSRFLLRFEKETGHILFEKTGSGFIPTPAGQVYLDACRQILEVWQNTYASIIHLHQSPESTIHLGVTPYRGTQIFSEIYSDFYLRYPTVSLKLHEGYMTDLKSGIINGEIDIALGTLKPQDEVCFSFASSSYEQLCLAVPMSHPAAVYSNDSAEYFPSIDLHRFSDAPFVMWGDDTTNSVLIREYMIKQSFSPTIIYQSNNALLINEMLKTETAVGFIPRSFCKPHEKRVYFSMWPPLQSFIGAFFKKGRLLSEPERYFVYLVLKATASGDQRKSMNIYHNKISQEIIKEFMS